MDDEQKKKEQAARMIDDAFQNFEDFGGATLRTFGPEMVEANLNGHEIRFYTGDDGSRLFEIATRHGYDLRILISCEGSVGQVCAVRVTARASIAREGWGRAAFACNEWMRDKRWPRAFLEIEDAASSANAELLCDGHSDFSRGTTQEQLNLFLDHTIVGAMEFFEWAKTEKKLF